MRRTLGLLLSALLALVALHASGQPVSPAPKASFADMKVTAEDRVLGSGDAPVTVIEYASLTCPHCAAFSLTMLPPIRKEFIEPGIVRLIYRDFPLDRLALSASQIARCAAPDRYFDLIESLFATQHLWVRDPDPLSAVAQIAIDHGLAPGRIRECLADRRIEDAVLAQRLDAERSFGVTATPTIFIGGESYGGGLTLEQFRAVVARQRAQR